MRRYIALFFVLLYSILSLGRHYEYRSTAFDLGIYNQAIYQYATGQGGSNTLRQVPHLLGDHAEFILFLFAPFYWLFGSYTLLIIQIIAVIVGGYGVHRLSWLETEDEYLSLAAMLIFFLSFGVISAIIFDFHSNVIGMMFLPWMFAAMKKNRILSYYVLFALFLLSKETLAITGIFLGLSVFIAQKDQQLHGLVTMVTSAAYFWIVFSYIIPHFNGGRPYEHWIYEALGANFSEAIGHTIRHPFYTALSLFDHRIKLQAWGMFLACGGLLTFLDLRYALLLIPIVTQKFLTTSQATWSFRFHYNIELCMVMALALPLVLKRFSSRQRYGTLIFFLTLNTVLLPVLIVLAPAGVIRGRTPRAELEAVHEATQLIPREASVSAQDTLVPHLADRKSIYLFPQVNDATYVLLEPDCCSSVEPYHRMADFKKDVDAALQDSDRDVVFHKEGVYLLKKK